MNGEILEDKIKITYNCDAAIVTRIDGFTHDDGRVYELVAFMTDIGMSGSMFFDVETSTMIQDTGKIIELVRRFKELNY